MAAFHFFYFVPNVGNFHSSFPSASPLVLSAPLPPSLPPFITLIVSDGFPYRVAAIKQVVPSLPTKRGLAPDSSRKMA